MQIVAAILGATAGFVFIAASAAMNWMFMIAQGKTVLEGQVLGLVSIAIDVVKALMPFFIGAAWAVKTPPIVTLPLNSPSALISFEKMKIWRGHISSET